MSREDLERLEKRGRRQGWLARIAKLLAGLAAAAALGAATVIVVRTVRPRGGLASPLHAAGHVDATAAVRGPPPRVGRARPAPKLIPGNEAAPVSSPMPLHVRAHPLRHGTTAAGAAATRTTPNSNPWPPGCPACGRWATKTAAPRPAAAAGAARAVAALVAGGWCCRCLRCRLSRCSRRPTPWTAVAEAGCAAAKLAALTGDADSSGSRPHVGACCLRLGFGSSGQIIGANGRPGGSSEAKWQHLISQGGIILPPRMV
jgi:hypothetical protein